MTTAGGGNRVKVINELPKAGGEITMPLYEYRCRECDQHCELLIRGEEKPTCPHCESTTLTKLLSVVSAPAATGTADNLPAVGCGQPQCGLGGCHG